MMITERVSAAFKQVAKKRAQEMARQRAAEEAEKRRQAARQTINPLGSLLASPVGYAGRLTSVHLKWPFGASYRHQASCDQRRKIDVGDRLLSNPARQSPRAPTVPVEGGQCGPRWAIVLSVGVFAVSAAILVALDAPSAGQRWTMLDLQIYHWGGLLARHSGALYSSQFPHLLHYHLRFTYPPMAALVFAAVSAIPTAVLEWVVMVASIAALVATLWLTWGALGYRRSAGRMAATLAAAGVALWLQPVQQTLSFGQVNLILMLVIVADLCLPDASWAKGVGVGLAAGFKLTPLIFIPYLLLTRRFRVAAVSLATFALTIAASFVVLPAQSRRYWLSGLFLNSRRAGSNAGVSNQSLHGALTRLLGSLPAAHPYWVATSVIIGIGGLMFAAWAARQAQEMLGILTCALTGLMISPISWAHHWLWIAPALVVTADMALRAGAPAPESSPGRLAGWKLPPRSRWAAWVGVAALAAPFFALPQSLVPRATIQDIQAHPAPLLTGNLYVITGLVLLCLIGLILLRPSRTETAGLIGELRESGERAGPGSAADGAALGQKEVRPG